MRFRVRYLALLVLTVSLAACSAGTSAAAGHSATPSAAASHSAAASPSATKSAAASHDLLSALPIPAGSTPWTSNTNALMSRVAFVRAFYVQNAWANEEGLYLRRGFVSGVQEGWINENGSQQSVTIARFATAAGAASAYDDLTSSYRQESKPTTQLSDPAVGGAGVIDPTLDKLGNARVEIAAHIGDNMIRVIEFTAVTPDLTHAKELMLAQYDALKNGT